MKRTLTAILVLLLAGSASALELVRQKNAATIIVFPLTDSTTPTALKSSAGSPDSEIDAWADGSAPDGFADCTNEATEIGSTGQYYLSLSADEMNADYVVIQCKATGAITQTILIRTVVGDPLNVATTTSGRTIVTDASGLVDANTVKVGPTGSGTAQTARDLGASVLLSPGTGTGQISLSSGAVTVGTLPSIPANWITAAGIATDAITSDEVAATAVTEIQTGLATPTNITAASGVQLAASQHVIVDSGTVTTLTNAPSDSSGVTTLLSNIGTPAGASLSADVAAVKSDTAAILVDTGTTLDGKINTIDGIVDTILTDTATYLPGYINAIQTTVTKLDGALEADGSGGYQYTALALENAPSGGLDAAGVRTALGMSTANLDTQLSTLQGTATKLETGLESDGASGYQWTTLALENGPSGDISAATDWTTEQKTTILNTLAALANGAINAVRSVITQDGEVIIVRGDNYPGTAPVVLSSTGYTGLDPAGGTWAYQIMLANDFTNDTGTWTAMGTAAVALTDGTLTATMTFAPTDSQNLRVNEQTATYRYRVYGTTSGGKKLTLFRGKMRVVP